MAEKITARKEYRGLGYAPAISVPGLIQERPVAATRPPATNPLLDFVKKADKWTDAFKDSKLRQLVWEDDVSKQAASEALSSIALGGWSRDAKGNPIPKGLLQTEEGVDLSMDMRALAFKGTDEELVTQYQRLGLAKEATPAFYAYLKRGMAQSIAQEYSSRLLARVEEASRLDTIDAAELNTQTIREIKQQESAATEEQFGKGWYLYAPDAITKVDEEFTRLAQGQFLKNRKTESEETFIRNASDLFESSQSPEDFLKNLGTLALPARRAGVKIKPLLAKAAINSATKFIRKGNIAAANSLIERMLAAEVVIPIVDKREPQTINSVMEGLTDKRLASVKSSREHTAKEILKAELFDQSIEDIKNELHEIKNRDVSLDESELQAKQYEQTAVIYQNRLDYLQAAPKDKKVPMVDEETERILGELLEKAEHNERVHKAADRERIERAVKERIETYFELNPNETVEQAQAALEKILSDPVELDRLDADRNPISRIPMEFDKTLFNTATWKAKLRGMAATNAGNQHQAGQVIKQLERLAENGKPEDLEAYRKLHSTMSHLLTSTQDRAARSLLDQAESLAAVENIDQYSVERKQGLGQVERDVVGISTIGGMRDATPEQEELLIEKNSEFLIRHRQQVRENYREYLKTRPETATKDADDDAMDEASRKARVDVIQDMKTETAPLLVKDNFSEYASAWKARVPEGVPGDLSWNPLTGFGAFETTTTPTDLKRRLVANDASTLKTLGRIPKGKGTIYSRINKLPAYRRGILIQSLKAAAEENHLLRTEAKKDRAYASKVLNDGFRMLPSPAPVGGGVVGPINVPLVKTKLSEGAVDRFVDELRAALVITGVTPEEVLSGRLSEGVDLEDKDFSGRKALFNPMLTPMFESSEQLLQIQTKDEETINKMAAKLRVDPKLLVSAQLRLLRTRGMIRSPKKK